MKQELEKEKKLLTEAKPPKVSSKTNEIKFTYMYQPPRKWTFEQQKLRKWIEENCEGKVLNLFAGKVKLNVDEVRNDLNIENPADYHLEAYEFILMAIKNNWIFDTIILDPPYSLRKSMEKYGGFHISKWTKLKKKIPLLVKQDGVVITLGYNSIGLGKAFVKEKVCLVCHHNSVNDTICLKERKVGDLRGNHNALSTL
jgi:23S rRNA G2069 N7-methylase RlmK/C1962 C5-methylase RlmI